MAKKKFNPLTPPFDLTADSVNDLTDHTQAIHNALLIDAKTLESHLTSYFVNLDGVATLSNKTLDNTNVITIKDANLTVQDDLDTSRQAQFQVSGISAATLRTITLQDANITMESTIGSQAKVDTHSALTTGVHDIVVTAPIIDQILKYNGVNWINGAQTAASPGPGISFYLDDAKIYTDSVDTYQMETLSKTPTTETQQDEYVTVTNSTSIIDQYMYNTTLGVTGIDAGEWEFDTYCYVNDINGVSVIVTSINKVVTGPGTVTLTGGPGTTTRTVTVTGGNPFVAGDYDAIDSTKTGYILTPNATLRINSYISTTQVTVSCKSTYTDETNVAYSITRFLFQDTTEEIDNTSVGLKSHIVVQPVFVTNVTDKLIARYYGRTSSLTPIQIHFTHNGTEHYTRFHTPLTTKHNDLAELQGGAGTQYYHLTSAEYTGTGTGNFVRETSPTLVTPILGNATTTTVNKVTITTPAASAVLTIADGVTLNVPSNATVSGTTSGTNTGDQTLASLGAVGVTDIQTVTNKRITPRVGTIADSATPTPAGDSQDMFTVTALAQAATFGVPTGTPTDGQKLIIRIKDNGTVRALSWNVIYRVIGVTLPTTTVISKTVYIGFIYNNADSKWDCVAVGQEV